jgi:hypothetical protein
MDEEKKEEQKEEKIIDFDCCVCDRKISRELSDKSKSNIPRQIEIEISDKLGNPIKRSHLCFECVFNITISTIEASMLNEDIAFAINNVLVKMIQKFNQLSAGKIITPQYPKIESIEDLLKRPRKN